jgi:hypothetical protein
MPVEVTLEDLLRLVLGGDNIQVHIKKIGWQATDWICQAQEWDCCEYGNKIWGT